MIDFIKLFSLATQSGMTLDPNTNQFTAGPAEMQRFGMNLEQEFQEQQRHRIQWHDNDWNNWSNHD